MGDDTAEGYNYRVRTPAAAKKATAAATLGDAVAACAAILERLAPADRKKAIAALRKLS